MKSANQINRVSQCPSHDTGKLAHGDKLVSSANKSLIVVRCHQDFWEFEESSTGEAALSRLGIGTGMWPLSSVGNCRGQKIFKLIIANPLGRIWVLYISRQTIMDQFSCHLYDRGHLPIILQNG